MTSVVFAGIIRNFILVVGCEKATISSSKEKGLPHELLSRASSCNIFMGFINDSIYMRTLRIYNDCVVLRRCYLRYNDGV